MPADVAQLPISYASPLKACFSDLVGQDAVAFADAIAPIEQAGIIPDVGEMAIVTYEQAKDRKQYGDLKGDVLPLNNVAYVMKYCAEDTTPTFYGEVNARSYNPNRAVIMPFKLYLWGLMKTLQMLLPYDGTMVNRGVKADVAAEYEIGREFVWHGFVSTTKTIEVLNQPMFLGNTGKRIIFQIELTQGQARDISKYSPLPEGEVLLPPGCKFKVVSALDQPTGLTIIQLRELKSHHWIFDLAADNLGGGVSVPRLGQIIYGPKFKGNWEKFPCLAGMENNFTLTAYALNALGGRVQLPYAQIEGYWHKPAPGSKGCLDMIDQNFQVICDSHLLKDEHPLGLRYEPLEGTWDKQDVLAKIDDYFDKLRTAVNAIIYAGGHGTPKLGPIIYGPTFKGNWEKFPCLARMGNNFTLTAYVLNALGGSIQLPYPQIEGYWHRPAPGSEGCLDMIDQNFQVICDCHLLKDAHPLGTRYQLLEGTWRKQDVLAKIDDYFDKLRTAINAIIHASVGRTC